VTYPVALALLLALTPSPTPSSHPATLMKLKDGRIMHLTAPPKISGGRVVFTTTDGHTYSLAEGDILSIGLEPTPTPTPRTINPLDSHNLGAIAREQRAETGKKAEVASKVTSTPKPTKRPKRTPTPRPRS
jgi:hypothetical protein